MLDQNTGNLLEAFRTQSAQKQLREPKALSSGKMVPKKSVKRKVRNGLIKLYVNAILIIIAVALVFVAYRLAVLPQLFPPEQTSGKEQEQPKVQAESQDYQGPATYASTFAYYWLSGDLQEASKYTANGYVFPENVSDPVKKEVEWSKIWAVDPIGKNKVNVVIQAFVKPAGNESSNENSENDNNSAKVVYLSVPMIFDNGKYGVYDIPTYLPPPGKASYKEENKTNAPLPKTDADALRSRIRLFLDEYYGGEPEKIAVYMNDSKPRATLRDSELKSIEEITVQAKSQDNLNKVLAEVICRVSIDNTEMLQKFKIDLTKSGKTWMVEKTDPYLPVYNKVKQED